MQLEILIPILFFIGFATLLQTLSGFGFGLLVVSSFTLFNLLPLTATTFVVSALGLFNSSTLVFKNLHQVNRRAFMYILLPGIPFMAVGFAILELLSAGLSAWLNILLGVAILFCCALLMLRRKNATPSGRAWGFAVAGSIGGLLGGMFSTFGPPVVFQCYRQRWPVNEIRFTLLAVFSVTAVIRLAMVPFGTLPSQITLLSTLIALPVVMISTQLGRYLSHKLSPQVVRRIALVMLSFSGITLIVKYSPIILL
ncbi:sulfite exporter TauE/SafE family protein [Alteromonas sp. 14N.309.X.WAT.G.H12]|uniref:sulfite exporter TauE/SafE family protein n=1 Tax=Alteromonas sp. 14N.309.X.WAT.G.H12 TaxID=3120824 RepID=UPI002FD37502